jgi:hypothetical protein
LDILQEGQTLLHPTIQELFQRIVLNLLAPLLDGLRGLGLGILNLLELVGDCGQGL